MTIRNIALFIDAANVDPARVAGIIKICSYIGEISIRKAFGDFSNPAMASWAETCRKLGIEPILAQSTCEGNQSGSGIALTIGLTDILNNKRVDNDIYALAGNLADFSPLCAAIKNKGKKVLGFGASSMNVPYRNTFNKFVTFESIPAILAKAASKKQPAYEALPEIPAPIHENASETITQEDKAFAAKAEDIGVSIEKNSDNGCADINHGEDASAQNKVPGVDAEPYQDTTSDNDATACESDQPADNLEAPNAEQSFKQNNSKVQLLTPDGTEPAIFDSAEDIRQPQKTADQSVEEELAAANEEVPASEDQDVLMSSEDSVLSDAEKELLNEEFNSAGELGDTKKTSRLSKIFGLFRKGKANKQELGNLDAPPDFGGASESDMDPNDAAASKSQSEELSLYDSGEAVIGEDVTEIEPQAEPIADVCDNEEQAEYQELPRQEEARSNQDASAPDTALNAQIPEKADFSEEFSKSLAAAAGIIEDDVPQDEIPETDNAAAPAIDLNAATTENSDIAEELAKYQAAERSKETESLSEEKNSNKNPADPEIDLNAHDSAKADRNEEFPDLQEASLRQDKDEQSAAISAEDCLENEVHPNIDASDEAKQPVSDEYSASKDDPTEAAQDLSDIPEAAAELAKKFNFRISKSDISAYEPSLFETESAVTNDDPVEQLPVSALILETLEASLEREHNGEMGVNAALNLLAVRGITPDWRAEGFTKWSDYLDSLTKTVQGASMEVLGSIIRLKTSNSSISPAFLERVESAFASNGIAEMNMASLEGFIRMNDESFTPAKYGSYSNFAELLKYAEKIWPESIKTEGDTVFFSPKTATENIMQDHELINTDALADDEANFAASDEDDAPNAPSEEEKALAKFFAENRAITELAESDNPSDEVSENSPESDQSSDNDENAGFIDSDTETEFYIESEAHQNEMVDATSSLETDETEAFSGTVSEIAETQFSEIEEYPATEAVASKDETTHSEEKSSDELIDSSEPALSEFESSNNSLQSEIFGDDLKDTVSESDSESEDATISNDNCPQENISSEQSEDLNPLIKEPENPYIAHVAPPASISEIAESENEDDACEAQNLIPDIQNADAMTASKDSTETNELRDEDLSEVPNTDSARYAVEPKIERASDNAEPYGEFEPIFEDPSDASEPIIIQPSVSKRIDAKEFELADADFALPKTANSETQSIAGRDDEIPTDPESIAMSDAEPVVARQPEQIPMTNSLEEAAAMIDECFEQEGKNSLMMKKLLSSLNRNHPELASAEWEPDTLAILIERLNEPVKRYRIVAGCVTKV